MYPLGSWFTSCPPSHAPKTRPIIAVHSQAREKVGVFDVYLSRLYATTVTALLSHNPLPHTLQIRNIYNLPHMTQPPQFLLWHELKTMFWLPSKLGTHSCSIHRTVLKKGHWRSKDRWDCAFPEPDQGWPHFQPPTQILSRWKFFQTSINRRSLRDYINMHTHKPTPKWYFQKVSISTPYLGLPPLAPHSLSPCHWQLLSLPFCCLCSLWHLCQHDPAPGPWNWLFLLPGKFSSQISVPLPRIIKVFSQMLPKKGALHDPSI